MAKAIIEAAAKGDMKTLRNLLKESSEVDVRNEYGATALMEAAKHGHLDAVSLLLDSGADVNARNRSGATALIRAASWGHAEVAVCLLDRGAHVEATDKKGTTALLKASTWGQHDVVQALLERGADVNGKNYRGTGTVMRAAKHGHGDVLKSLIDHGAEINAKKLSGSTALMSASARGHTAIVQALIEAGAQVDIREKDGGTALTRAALRGHPDIVSILLDAGADPRVSGKGGKTPLCLAAMSGHTEVVRRLLDWQIKHPEEESMELQADEFGDSPLILASRTGRTNVVRLLLGCSEGHLASDHLSMRNKDGDTALIEAARQGHFEIVQVLLEQGANPNLKNGRGRTALMVAAAQGNPHLVGVLLDHGSEAEATDAEGETALSLATRKGFRDVIEALKKRQRQVHTTDTLPQETIRTYSRTPPERQEEPLIHQPDELLRSVMQLTQESDFLEPEGELPSKSEVARAAFSMARIVSEHDSPILLLGESGSGKDFLADYIHKHSARASGPFRSLNCASLPRELAESELFGHEQGAFTGATRRKSGVFELAKGGTVFLNEIGEMDLDLQAKLLTFLDTQTFTRVGGEREIESNARIIAATNKDLKKEVESGSFRLDLYHRLAVWPIRVPPLRERIEDIPLLTKILISDLCGKSGRTPPTIPTPALAKLCSCRWEGNIRELRNCLERALILCRGDSLESKFICFDTGQETRSSQEVAQSPAVASSRDVKRKRQPKPSRTELKEAYEQYIVNEGWTRARLAKHFGVDSSTLKKWFKDAGLPAGTAGRPKKKPGQ